MLYCVTLPSPFQILLPQRNVVYGNTRSDVGNQCILLEAGEQWDMGIHCITYLSVTRSLAVYSFIGQN